MKKFIHAGKQNGSSYYVECVDGINIKAVVSFNGIEETKLFVQYPSAEKWITNKIGAIMRRKDMLEEY